MGLARSTVSRFVRFANRCFRSRGLDPRHELGLWGEQQAARFLRRRGYKVLYRRFKAKRGGEVDLVCRHGDTLVFVEVKTRSNLEHGRPYEAVDAYKRCLLIQGADAWLRLLQNPNIYHRFDIVEVVAGDDGEAKCHVIENAFTHVHEHLY